MPPPKNILDEHIFGETITTWNINGSLLSTYANQPTIHSALCESIYLFCANKFGCYCCWLRRSYTSCCLQYYFAYRGHVSRLYLAHMMYNIIYSLRLPTSINQAIANIRNSLRCRANIKAIHLASTRLPLPPPSLRISFANNRIWITWKPANVVYAVICARWNIRQGIEKVHWDFGKLLFRK